MSHYVRVMECQIVKYFAFYVSAAKEESNC